MTISVGLNTAVRALLAQQQAMNAVGHNIANVNTPGYSRQRVRLAPVPPGDNSGVGNGVQFLGVERVRDLFIDFQIRSESHSAGDYSARADSLRMVELAFGEPGAGGLRGVMDGFFNAWRDLANAPEQSAARSAVVQAGETLAFTVNQLEQSLGAIRTDANTRLATSVGEVNDLAREIADLNQRIVSVRATGDPAADLSDQRDLAIDRLAQLTDLRFVHQENGSIDIFVGGRALVSGVRVNEVRLEMDPGNNNYFALEWAQDGSPVEVQSGEIGGLLHQRDVDLPGRIGQLHTLVSQMVTDINAVHAAGFGLDGVTTGVDFFTGTDATDIAVNVAITGDLALVAAAGLPGAPGNATNALGIADLQSAANLTGGSETYGAYYNGMVTRLGVALRDTVGTARAQALTIGHLDRLRDSVSGVNLDEEMVNLLQYQRGYEAAARLIRAIDEMIETLLATVR